MDRAGASSLSKYKKREGEREIETGERKKNKPHSFDEDFRAEKDLLKIGAGRCEDKKSEKKKKETITRKTITSGYVSSTRPRPSRDVYLNRLICTHTKFKGQEK